MNERIKDLRKALGLSQSSFGQALGVSRDVINNIERGRNKTPISDMFISHLCSTFKADENWLRTGIGDMFTKNTTSTSDNPNVEHLSQAALKFIKDFYNLSKDDQEAFIKQAEKMLGVNSD